MTLHIKFAYSTYRIALRYFTLNNALRTVKTYRKYQIQFTQLVCHFHFEPYFSHHFI